MDQRGIVHNPAAVGESRRIPPDNLFSAVNPVVEFKYRLMVIFIDSDIRLVVFKQDQKMSLLQ